MKKCISKSLKAASGDNTLPIVGMMYIPVNSANVTKYVFGYDSTPSLHAIIDGDSYFTNSDGIQNLGKDIELSTSNTIYMAPGEFNLLIPKYDLTSLGSSTANGSVPTPFSELKFSPKLANLAIDVTEGQTGNLNDVLDGKSITRFYISGDSSKITGNISEWMEDNDISVSSLRMTGIPFVEGDISVIGDHVTNFTNDTNYNNLKACKALYGNIVEFINKEAATQLNYVSGSFTGDFSKVKNTFVYYMQTSNPSTNFTWTTERSHSATIVSFDSKWGGVCNFGNDLDAMLINQAQCVAGSSNLIIRVDGTRTDASNAAVATLKGMGYNIYVNGNKL